MASLFFQAVKIISTYECIFSHEIKKYITKNKTDGVDRSIVTVCNITEKKLS